MTDELGRSFDFTRDANDKIASATDGARTVTFDYTSGKLASVTDPLGGVTTYVYQQFQNRITGVTHPERNTPYTHAYDSQGRVTSQTDQALLQNPLAYVDPLGTDDNEIRDEFKVEYDFLVEEVEKESATAAAVLRFGQWFFDGIFGDHAAQRAKKRAEYREQQERLAALRKKVAPTRQAAEREKEEVRRKEQRRERAKGNQWAKHERDWKTHERDDAPSKAADSMMDEKNEETIYSGWVWFAAELGVPPGRKDQKGTITMRRSSTGPGEPSRVVGRPGGG